MFTYLCVLCCVLLCVVVCCRAGWYRVMCCTAEYTVGAVFLYRREEARWSAHAIILAADGFSGNSFGNAGQCNVELFFNEK